VVVLVVMLVAVIVWVAVWIMTAGRIGEAMVASVRTSAIMVAMTLALRPGLTGTGVLHRILLLWLAAAVERL
jgi:hypothetical protein